MIELASCEQVPLNSRRIYVLATYLYLRGSELRALEWSDIDLEREIVHVHRAMARDQRSTKTTKGQLARRNRIETAIMPLLRAMRAETATNGRIVTMRDRKHWAKNLRAHLQLAGVDRAELFTDDETRKHITFHDLKATAVTWMALRGDNPLAIMQRAAHKSFSTTESYLREAEMVGCNVGEPFPELPKALLGRTPVGPQHLRLLTSQ